MKFSYGILTKQNRCSNSHRLLKHGYNIVKTIENDRGEGVGTVYFEKNLKKKLIFDFDGTLVDSMKQYADAMIRVLEENDIVYPDDIIKIITPLGYEGATRYFINELGLDLTADATMARMTEIAINEYTNNIPAKESVAETLKELKKRGYSLNVLTASPHVMLDVCLKRNGIYDLFDNVWSCDDFNTTKADVGIYYAVAKKLNTEVENCIFFDDNINALIAGKSSGMRVVGVYDGSSADCESDIRSMSDGYVVKLSDFLDLEI